MLGFVGHQDHVGPVPAYSTADRAARSNEGADSPSRGSTSPGPRATSQVPSSSSPIGSATGDMRGMGDMVGHGAMGNVPRHALCQGPKPWGASVRGSLSQNVDPRGGDADRPGQRSGGFVLQGPAQEAVGHLERVQCRDPVEAVQEGSCVDGLLRQRPAEVELAGERVDPTPSRTTGQCGAGDRSEAQRDQLRQVVVGWSRSSGTEVVARLSARRRGGERNTEVPSRPDVVRIDEPRAVGHVAPEVECGDRGPVGAVGHVIVRDAPQRVAASYDVRRRGTGGYRRRRPFA